MVEKRHTYRHAVSRVSPMFLVDNTHHDNNNSFEMGNRNESVQKLDRRNSEEHRQEREAASPYMGHGLNIVVYNKILVEN